MYTDIQLLLITYSNFIMYQLLEVTIRLSPFLNVQCYIGYYIIEE